MRVDLTIDTASVTAALAGIKDGVPKALTRALNRSIDSAESLAVKTMAENLGITQTTVRKYGAVKTTYATWSNLRATTGVSGYRMPLTLFRPYQSAKGVAYGLPGGQGFIPHAFLATVRARGKAHRGVFVRAPLPSVRAGAGRSANAFNLPIKERKGPALPSVLLHQWETQAQAKAAAILQKNLDHEVSFLLSKQSAA